MRIDTNVQVETSGMDKICDFKISSNGIMVKALTSRLYSNPIASIVRELASNALDACKHRPMEIKLPSILDPQFIIRDYGPGLSVTQMQNVFCHFGESTKRSDDNQIGGFGLGAKSPFALVDTFFIISYQAGTASKYAATIGQDGMPGLHLIDFTPTDTTGLEIIVPSTNYAAFYEALQQIEFFNPRPIVDGKELPPTNTLWEDSQFIISKDGPRRGFLIGPVFYPVSTSKLTDLDVDLPVARIVLKAPIGGIEVTASREEVVYNKKTIDFLKTNWSKAVENYRQHVEDLIQSLTKASDIIDAITSCVEYKDVDIQGVRFTTYGMHIPSASCLSKKARSKTKWVPSGISNWLPSDVIYVIDESHPGIINRIKSHFQACAPQATSPVRNLHMMDFHQASVDILDKFEVPYILLSSTPKLHNRKSYSPRKYRTFTSRRTFTTADYQADHYIILNDQKQWLGQAFTVEWQDKIQQRLGFQIYVLPHNFKGKLDNLTDATPLFKDAFNKWHAEHGNAWHYSRGDYSSYAITEQHRRVIQSLSDLGLLPSVPRLTVYLPDEFSCFLDGSSGFSWMTALRVIAAKYPLLNALIDEQSPQLPNLVNLIVKG